MEDEEQLLKLLADAELDFKRYRKQVEELKLRCKRFEQRAISAEKTVEELRKDLASETEARQQDLDVAACQLNHSLECEKAVEQASLLKEQAKREIKHLEDKWKEQESSLQQRAKVLEEDASEAWALVAAADQRIDALTKQHKEEREQWREAEAALRIKYDADILAAQAAMQQQGLHLKRLQAQLSEVEHFRLADSRAFAEKEAACELKIQDLLREVSLNKNAEALKQRIMKLKKENELLKQRLGSC